jgi:hypothetical protein
MRWVWIGIGALASVPLIAIPSYLYGAAQGKAKLRNELVEQRLVTKDKISELDEIVFNADESALCDLLGSC